MSKITRRMATTAATLAVAGGVLFTTGGAASAATHDGENHSGAVATRDHRDHAARPDNLVWDGHRLWHRYTRNGDWYSTDHGDRYRFDGHRFYRWKDGKWKAVTSDYARRHDFDRGDFSTKGHHGDDGHSGHGH
jgi:hypothetical protein